MAKTRKRLQAQQEVTECVIYCRVSTEDQAASGLGLAAQETRCRAYAAAHGLTVVEVFVDDGWSAKTLKRPALQAALAALRPGRLLLAYKLDRLTRNLADFPTFAAAVEAAGAEWGTVEEKIDTSSATGRLMLGIILQLSQWEREVISERTSAALLQKKARGERLGGSPLGYRTDAEGNVKVDEEEMETVRRARALRSEGLTLQAIADQFTAEGRQTKRNGGWTPTAVRRLLQPRYLDQIVNQPAGQ